jgi:regulatory protein
MEPSKTSIQLAIEHYCNYQERSHQEVRNKLYELGCNTDEVNAYISELIEHDRLNEERYARAIARGKFRQKQWGRVKIIQLLKTQQVSAYNLKKALEEIDADDYDNTLRKLLSKKWLELRGEKNIFIKKKKAYSYLVQKGYESDIVISFLNEIINSAK